MRQADAARRERLRPSRAGLPALTRLALGAMSSLMPSPEPSPATIVISELATGPTPPHAARTAWPNVLHTRIAAGVAEMGPAPRSRRIIAGEPQPLPPIPSPPGGGNRPRWTRGSAAWAGAV